MLTRAVLLLAFALPPTMQAQGSDVLRGRVTDREKQPLARVEVVVLTETNAVLQSAETDEKGRYAIVVREPRDVYVVSFRRVGYVPFSRTVRRSGLVNAFELDDVSLAARLDVLQPVVTRAAVLVPLRGGRPVPAGAELNAGGGSAFTIDPSDLSSLLALLPGVQTVGDSGLSILGAGPNQNRVVVDGADFGGGNIPRDAIQGAKLITNTFDASQGRFSGGEAMVTTRRGGPEFETLLRGQLVHPSLSWPDQRSSNPVPVLGSLSGFSSGPLHGADLTYFAAVDLSHRSIPASSLLSPRGSVLSDLGVVPDTVTAVANALAALGAPVSFGGVGRTTTLRGSASLRADLRQSGTTSYTLSSLVNWSRTPHGSVGALAFPSASTANEALSIRVLLSGGTYLKGRVLDEFRVSAASSTAETEPLVRLPAGIVQVGTVFDDLSAGMSMLRFGGSGSGADRTRGDLLTASHEMSWFTVDGRHQFKLTQEALVERRRSGGGANAFGTYEFTSLDDLVANRPESFQRTLMAPDQRSSAFTVGASVGDAWRAIDGRLDVQAGLRVDATTFGVRPPLNAAAESVFGLRTNRVPTDVGLSPRLGFVLRLGARRPTPLIPPGATTLDSKFGRGELAPIDAAGVAIAAGADQLKVSGGVGAFRGTIPTQQVGALAQSTGLSSGIRYLECIGDATPLPDWSLGASTAPDVCRGGASAVYADSQPRIAVLGPGFRAPMAWRANIAVEGLRIAGIGIAPQLTLAHGSNVQSIVDRNLRTTRSFVLAAEADRPVFTPMPAIHGPTGLVGPSAGRLDGSFGQVNEFLSDLHYRVAQVTVGVAPRAALPGGSRVFGAYAWTSQRVEQRGFGGTTSGDPRTTEWVSGSQPAHQIIVGATNLGTGWLRLATRLTFSSGMAFTPLASRDINGDGLANDRAFIPDPATLADTAFARGVRSLVESSNAGVRDCLERQFGTIAVPNSCRTAWSARMDLAANAAPPGGFGFGNRWRMTATFVNAGSALVRLFRLENTPLGRGANSAIVDTRLLNVTGFDPAAQRFTYQVNQQFGRELGNGVHRGLPPFELQVGIEVRLGFSGPPALRTPVARTAAGADSVDRRRIAEELALRFFGASPVASLLALRDSLALTDDQLAGIRGAEATYVANRDSILAPVVVYAVSQGKGLVVEALRPRIEAVAESVRQLGKSMRQRAVSFLTLEQQQMLPMLERRL